MKQYTCTLSTGKESSIYSKYDVKQTVMCFSKTLADVIYVHTLALTLAIFCSGQLKDGLELVGWSITSFWSSNAGRCDREAK